MLSFNALLPTGEELTCTPKHNKDLFYGLIGGLGLLGVFTSITPEDETRVLRESMGDRLGAGQS